MITCRICANIYSQNREHCPTCGTENYESGQSVTWKSNGIGLITVVAIGAERARQLPESPRTFQLVD